jgi:hypothetical protein
MAKSRADGHERKSGPTVRFRPEADIRAARKRSFKIDLDDEEASERHRDNDPGG